MRRRPPRSTLFPDTTLFRSGRALLPRVDAAMVAGDRQADLLRHVGGVDPDIEVLAHAELLEHGQHPRDRLVDRQDRKSTRLNSSHANISYAVFCLKKKI